MSASRTCARGDWEAEGIWFCCELWVGICDPQGLEAVGRKDLRIAARSGHGAAADNGRGNAASACHRAAVRFPLAPPATRRTLLRAVLPSVARPSSPCGQSPQSRTTRTLRISSRRWLRPSRRCASRLVAPARRQTAASRTARRDFQKAIGRLEGGDLRQTHFLHQPVLQGPEEPLDASLGLRDFARRSIRSLAPAELARTATRRLAPALLLPFHRAGGHERCCFYRCNEPADARSVAPSRPTCAGSLPCCRALKRAQIWLVASSIIAINWQAGPRSSSQANGELSCITNSPRAAPRSRHTCMFLAWRGAARTPAGSSISAASPGSPPILPGPNVRRPAWGRTLHSAGVPAVPQSLRFLSASADLAVRSPAA